MKTAYLKIKAGTEIPGCKLVGAKSNRKWIDEVFAAKSLRELLGGETYSKPKLVTPAQAEAALKKLGKKPAAISALTSYLWEKPEGGTVIVPDSDRREAIKSDSAFSGIKLEDEI